MNGFVLDASLAASWFLPEPYSPLAELAYRRCLNGEAVAPALWWYEMNNIFVSAARRNRIAKDDCHKALILIRQLPVTLVPPMDQPDLMALAMALGLTAYDAAYLGVAKLQSLPLATLDAALIRAAQDEHIPVLQAESQ